MSLRKKLCILALGVCSGAFQVFCEEAMDSPAGSSVVSPQGEDSMPSVAPASDSAAKSMAFAAPANPKAQTAQAQPALVPGIPLWDFSRLAAQVVRGVVSITAVQSPAKTVKRPRKMPQGSPFDDFFRMFPQAEAPRKIPVGGSGFVIQITKDTVFIGTNYHIVEDATNVKVQLDEKCEVPAVIHGSDPRTDLAVLKINVADIPAAKRQLLVPLPWGVSAHSAVGQWVIAVGNPFGLGNTVTAGIISAKGRDLHIGGVSLTDDFIQHSAQINAGNSGGCLINMKGEVIGINTVIVTPSGGNVGIGFAIPSDNAKVVLEQLITHKKVRHGALGISVDEFTKEHMAGLGIKSYQSGVVVMRVDKSGPAAAAGIQEDDVIVKFDDTVIENIHQLSRTVDNAQVDTEHKVTVIRKGKEVVVKVKVGDFAKLNGISTEDAQEDGLPAEILGLTLSDLPPSKTDDLKGALVRKVAQDSAADNAGLRPQDVIVAVNQEEVRSAQEFRAKVIKASKTQDFVLVKVNRGGMTTFLAIKMSDDPDLKKGMVDRSPAKSGQVAAEKPVEKEPESKAERALEAPRPAPKAEKTVGEIVESKSEVRDAPSSQLAAPPSPTPAQEPKPGLWSRFVASLKRLFGL